VVHMGLDRCSFAHVVGTVGDQGIRELGPVWRLISVQRTLFSLYVNSHGAPTKSCQASLEADGLCVCGKRGSNSLSRLLLCRH